MVKRKLVLVALLMIMLIIATEATVFADNDVKIWRDPLLKRYKLQKIFLLTPTTDINTNNDMISERQFEKLCYDWIIKGIRATKQGKNITIKTLPEVERELEIIHGEKSPSKELLMERAYARGYEAFISVKLSQEFITEVIPEHTESQEIYVPEYDYYYDKNGNVQEFPTYSQPEYETVTIPEKQTKYLSTECKPELFLLDEYIQDVKSGNLEGNNNAVVDYKIYRRYQGGDVTKVLENIIKASMKCLFTGKKK